MQQALGNHGTFCVFGPDVPHFPGKSIQETAVPHARSMAAMFGHVARRRLPSGLKWPFLTRSAACGNSATLGARFRLV
jgi:hypothetical protein